MYTLEQIKNFTPIERNRFIDEIIVYIKRKPNKEWMYLFVYFIDDIFLYKDVCTELNVPILGLFDSTWFDNEHDRISFLKSIKTAQ